MKQIILFVLATILTIRVSGQELYVSTEPASNMPKNSVGLRLTTEVMPGSDVNARFSPEVMIGLTKSLMVHGGIYFSDLYQKSQRFEGYNVYAKYRFLSVDSVQRHFRMAAYARYSSSNNPTYWPDPAGGQSPGVARPTQDEINPEGDHTTLQGGIIATQLLHKLAISGSLGYIRAFDNGRDNKLLPGHARNAVAYTLSAGYLQFPRVYKSYSQPNLNIYLEFLGKANPGRGQSYLEAAPALQLILNSRTRIDLSKRFQLYGNMDRLTKNMYLVRIEHNLFNVL